MSLNDPAPQSLPDTASAARASGPRATYRVQLNAQFGFRKAAAIVPYLARLGVSHIYCSPYLAARPGSQHGYDIIDHNTLNPEIGDAADYAHFTAVLAAHDMRQMVDVVPNHMGVMGADNAWWLDVLENGPAAKHAGFFDIDWQPLKAELRGKVLLPVLGDHYGKVLERGELKLAFDAERGQFSVHYYEHRFPLDPRTYPHILGTSGAAPEKAAPNPSDEAAALQSLLTAFGRLPARSDTAPEKVAQRASDAESCKRALAWMCARAPGMAARIDACLARLNGTPGDGASFDALDALMREQAWRLAYWRVASDEINYRRFFDINDLAALRMENATVFDATHCLLADLLASGKVDCLRIDHPDGLYDPAEYFRRLQQTLLPAVGATQEAQPHIYVAIEKITASYERLSQQWAVAGTTGYRFANVVHGLFVDGSAEARMDRIYRSFAGDLPPFDELLYRCKRLIVQTALAGELNVLANLLGRIAESCRDTRDYTQNSLRHVLAEIVACFPVYRTYIDSAGASDEDRRYIDWAVAAARKRSRSADASVFEFVREVLTTRRGDGRASDYRADIVAFAQKFQQFTAPVMAKGCEDTSFYIYNRLVSLNEVGGDPRTFGMGVTAFHGASMDRARNWPQTMLATSTHDNKRSEDVRARIAVLSEMPALWRLMLRRWSRTNRSRKRMLDQGLAPSRNDEYLLYQTLLGTWPQPGPGAAELAVYCERILRYMQKAVREAKQHSSWVNPDPAYETALHDFIVALLTPGRRNRFLADFVPFAEHVARYGLYNGLSQALIKFTSPGIPDIYQGNEILDFSLVDPDNRRPIDYAQRAHLLEGLMRDFDATPAQRAASLRRLLDAAGDGRAKLLLTWRALELRRQDAALFRHGDYLPLAATGACAEHVCAYARRHGERAVVVLAPRLYARLVENGTPPLGEVWGDTCVSLAPLGPLAAAPLDVLSGRHCGSQDEGRTWLLPLQEILNDFPVALITLRLAPAGAAAAPDA
ncbi:MAG: malto-oligosyltrehalose synthase [Rhodocyclaceae bacterium]|nr:malto-oligosyltrehalose synthase [Rhodocyclaceae bacterium]MBX3670201.1 malto-oligosyltrehalose synthase [Rhodocyclaceae bacterium]